MEKSNSSVLSPLPNQPTWLSVEGTNWVIIKDPFLSKESVYNLRDRVTHRPAEYFEMMEVREMLQSSSSTDKLEYKVWSDLSARCTWIAYNAVKELSIREHEIISKGHVIYNLRNKLVVANNTIQGWKKLALASIVVDAIIAGILLVYF